MDIKSIVRVFRFTELQNKSERDPDAKRPPTMKFLGVALVLGLLLVLISFWSAPKADVNGAMPLAISSTVVVPATNDTGPSDASPPGPQPQDGPAETSFAARTNDDA